MYKCGWNGCEKAYGTLNHLNAHVTMQSHGQKRTPEGAFSMSHINHPFAAATNAIVANASPVVVSIAVAPWLGSSFAQVVQSRSALPAG
jgi:hypothetical protein